MRKELTVAVVAALALSAVAVPALLLQESGGDLAAQDRTSEERHLDADTDGTARSVETGEVHEAEVDVTGNVTVRESGEGVDETAQTDGPTVEAEITVGDETYTIPVSVVGEGTSYEQSGAVDDQAWRLHVQGEDYSGGQDGSGAVFSGNLTLVGGNGEFTVTGEGTLTVRDQDDATTYDLDYAGSATFE